MSKIEELKKISDEILNLKNSPLYKYRIKNKYLPVVGEGSLNAKIMFVGEAPGKNEAITGKPFCGVAGKILDKMFDSIKIKREDVYITSVVKDRPQENRDPTKEEVRLYSPFLFRQIEIIKPKIIVALGRFAMNYLMKEFGLEDEIDSISKIHGKAFSIKTSYGKAKIVVLYHPSVISYNYNMLGDLQKDFKKLKNVK